MSEVKEDPELIALMPIEASMSGRNSVYNFCERRGQSVSYAVCLHTIRRIENNDLPAEIAVECQRGYCHNNCIAKKHKAEEVAAGHALYFRPRPRHITDPVAVSTENKSAGAVSSGKYDMSNASYARGWAIGGGAGEVRDKPKAKARPAPPPPKKKDGFVQEGMSDVVNVLMKEHEVKKAAPAPKPAAPKPAPEAPKPTAAAPAADLTSTRPLPGESTADFIKRRAALKVAK
ncbi:hypothetical protein CNR34_00058 [Pseudomonas phage nickie]|uniref:Uncharacterized protein n=1 Tax=Pseudomonas phage nickie TaxID=2048977 RepID=A0A2H4P741_9CAUD|nr:hypothetical protein FDJ16_gp107 [Pseudomonas phage nickie]ATW57991.1 hypothetical protein CNR34_00058 [Pseudomonas phage nickie]